MLMLLWECRRLRVGLLLMACVCLAEVLPALVVRDFDGNRPRRLVTDLVSRDDGQDIGAAVIVASVPGGGEVN